MKRVLALLFAIASTVGCAEREKESPTPPPAPTVQQVTPLTNLPKGFVVKKPLNVDKVENPGAPASASVSAAPSAK